MKKAAVWVIRAENGKEHPLCSRCYHEAVQQYPLVPGERVRRADVLAEVCEDCADLDDVEDC